MKQLNLFLLTLLFFSSCDRSRVYEKNIDMSGQVWNADEELIFDFGIRDTSQTYNLLYNIRYTNNYPFYNLYVTHRLYDSSGYELKTIKQPQGMDLFLPTTGEPKGSGLGSISDYRILFLPDYKFPYEGSYSMKVRQYMRIDSLPGVVSFGLRVEKKE